MPNTESLLPEITDADVDWVGTVMGLDPFDRPRRNFLKTRSTVDLSACPGSGKTTLIVAKLAILARKWPYRTNGVCVLSHTNVAREQIEHRLGRTVVGQRLLSYPHFIDTIHGFVNRFFSLPWLHSNGYPSPTIDDDVTTAFRRGVLAGQEYWSVESFLARKHTGFDRLRISGRDLSFNLGDRQFPGQSSTKSFQNAKRAVETAAQAGYFCYDEMFVWANALLEDHPDVADWLAVRFPLVIIDEMQDTSIRQASFLTSVFPRGSDHIVVQRAGDPNQQVFDWDHAGSNLADPYPDPDPVRCLEIPNSHRFGNEIAGLASPFAVHPVGEDGLFGIGPKGPGNAAPICKHAIFVFPDNSADGVLDAFGKHVLDVLGAVFGSGSVVHAIGHVHRHDPIVAPGHAHYPKSVGHYWHGYSAAISRKSPNPETLSEYIRVAQGLVSEGRSLFSGVEKIATGIFELARRLGEIGDLKRSARTHRAVVEALQGNAASLAAYRDLLLGFLVEKVALSEGDWPCDSEQLITVAAGLCNGETDRTRKVERFLVWPNDDPIQGAAGATASGEVVPNTVRFNDGSRMVDVRLGSIHSVKGQTHLATLLLNTYWHGHSAKRMMPWLLGLRTNGENAGTQDVQRLLHAYVAMTRPSHLLCLAVPRSALGGDGIFDKDIETIKRKGWQVAEIVDGATRWRD